MHKKSSPKPRPKSCIVSHFKTDPKLRCRPKSYTEPDTSLHAENINYYCCETPEHTFPQLSLAFQDLRRSFGRLDPVIEETDQNINCRTNSNFDQPINPARARPGDQISFFQVQSQDSHTNQYSDKNHSDLQEVSWLTSNVCSQEVKIGLRKDVYPDSHPYYFSARYHDGLRNLSSNRCYSMPESQILLLQDSYWSDVLSLRYRPDLYGPSVRCFRSASPETLHHHQLTSLPLCHSRAGARPLTYPNNQGGLGIAPVICAVTQSDSPSNHSGKVYIQTHL